MPSIVTEKCNLMLNGAWNPAIINPDWVKKKFPTLVTQDEFPLQVAFGAISGFRFEVKDVMIDPNNGKLFFQPKTITEESLQFISEIAKGIFETLCHTPVTAAGCNFTYLLDEKEKFLLYDIIKGEEISELYRSKGIGELTSENIQHKLSFDDYTLNVVYITEGPERMIQYNFHYSVDFHLVIERLISHYRYSEKLNAVLIGE